MRNNFVREDKLDILRKQLEQGIETAGGVDDDYTYITIGDARMILRLMDRLEDYRRQEDDGR